ncbi:MAG: cytochrome c maturation protein CcmE [Beijerinckiaceae bacterium]
MTRKGRRMTMIGAAGAALALAAGLVLFALRDNIVFFYTPAEVAEKSVQPGARLRLGGLVKQGSIERGAGKAVTFVVTDTKRDIKVNYTGMLPDLFREGQGVVTEGILVTSTTFKADSVLAKHDEKYMPRELTDSLKKQGLWQHTKADGSPAAQGSSKP